MSKEKNPTQEYLSQILRCEARIENLMGLKTRWQSKRERITSNLESERVSGTHNTDKICDITAKIQAIEKRLEAAIDACDEKEKEIEAIIDQVQDEKQYRVLTKVYSHGKSLEQVACEMDYSYRQVCNIHGRALQAVAAVMEP